LAPPSPADAQHGDGPHKPLWWKTGADRGRTRRCSDGWGNSDGESKSQLDPGRKWKAADGPGPLVDWVKLSSGGRVWVGWVMTQEGTT